MRLTFTGADVFDGERTHRGAALNVEDGRVTGIGAPGPGERVELDGGVLGPGLIDLQVNGAGGVAVDGDLTIEGLRAICEAQARLGALGCLPTLITDGPEATRRVVEVGLEAARAGVPGFLGLHLEGPHLDPRRRGAHDPALIRPMGEEDLALLLIAAAGLSSLVVTLAPTSATTDQVARLAAAGVVVSLGHSDCTLEEARAFQAAGARCATHLFNAMSPLGHRAPGLVGAVLAGDGFAGLIADGVHVDPVAMRVALAAKADGVFLVSDCMAVAGTDLAEFDLGGRRVRRRDGRLTLADGTLAGADLTLPRAIAVLVRDVGVAPERALAMATSVPARALGRDGALGRLAPGRVADLVHLGPDWRLRGAWRAGVAV